VLQESAQWHERHAGKVRWATAVAAMLFVFVISADLVTNGLRGADDMATSSGSDQMEVMQATEATPAAADADAEAEIPTAEIEPEARTTGEDAPALDEEVPDSDDSTAAQEESQDEPEVGTFMEPSEDAESGDDAESQETLAMEQESISEEPVAETQAEVDPAQMRWRIAEVSLALVLAILLAIMIGLPRQRGRRRR
jgi:hypothetical protein